MKKYNEIEVTHTFTISIRNKEEEESAKNILKGGGKCCGDNYFVRCSCCPFYDEKKGCYFFDENERVEYLQMMGVKI